jgi:hypothetical protein
VAWHELSEREDKDELERVEREDPEDQDPGCDDSPGGDVCKSRAGDGLQRLPGGYIHRVWTPWRVAEGETMTVGFSAVRAFALLRVSMV